MDMNFSDIIIVIFFFVNLSFLQINNTFYYQWYSNHKVWGVSANFYFLLIGGRNNLFWWFHWFSITWSTWSSSSFLLDPFFFQVFSAPYSLRFPRIDRVRYDKPWHDCLDVQCKRIAHVQMLFWVINVQELLMLFPFKRGLVSVCLNLLKFFFLAAFVELVHSSNGTTQKGKEYGGLQDDKPKQFRSSRKGEKKNVSIVPSHFLQTDVSDIKGETSIFSDMVFCILWQLYWAICADLFHVSYDWHIKLIP